jgi:hypothetical protein
VFVGSAGLTTAALGFAAAFLTAGFEGGVVAGGV